MFSDLANHSQLGDFGVSLIIRQDDQCLPEDFFALANRDMPESEKGFGTRNARPPVSNVFIDAIQSADTSVGTEAGSSKT